MKLRVIGGCGSRSLMLAKSLAHQTDELLYYCKMIKQYANQDVCVFNFTNPAGLVTQALRDQGYDFVYGISGAPLGFLRQITGLYGTNVKELSVRQLISGVKYYERTAAPAIIKNYFKAHQEYTGGII